MSEGKQISEGFILGERNNWYLFYSIFMLGLDSKDLKCNRFLPT